MRHLDALRRLAGYVRAVLLDPWRSGPLVWSLVGVFLAISIFRYTSLTAPNHDVAWLLLAAGRMLDGGTYLTEFYEVNWPMAIMIVLGVTFVKSGCSRKSVALRMSPTTAL